MIYEIAHQLGLVPLLALIVWGRKAPAAWWLFAGALSVSWFGDSAQHYLFGGWAAQYVWVPAQFALIFGGFLTGFGLVLALWAVAAFGVFSAVVSSPGPEWILTFAGSIGLLAVVRGPLTVPTFLYFGVGSLLYLGMVAGLREADFMAWWYGYQACRLAAVLAFLWLIGRRRNAWGTL